MSVVVVAARAVRSRTQASADAVATVGEPGSQTMSIDERAQALQTAVVALARVPDDLAEISTGDLMALLADVHGLADAAVSAQATIAVEAIRRASPRKRAGRRQPPEVPAPAQQ